MLKVAFHFCPEISLVILKIAIVAILSKSHQLVLFSSPLTRLVSMTLTLRC